jgi:protein subunit release factor A
MEDVDKVFKESMKKLELLNRCELGSKCKISKNTFEKIRNKYGNLRMKVGYKTTEQYERETQELKEKEIAELEKIYECTSKLCDEVLKEYIKAHVKFLHAQVKKLTKEVQALPPDDRDSFQSVIEDYQKDVTVLEQALNKDKEILSVLEYARIVKKFHHLK